MQTIIKKVGYIKGQNISTIVWTIDDITEFMDFNNDTGTITALDYAKAFDSINKFFGKFLV